ncbi:hypothetical protein GCM10025867_34980 [Frondihabitans sucicola]|uniref:Uncharacterized protein n=1 Tax=Frondihabitans sucicola TaxID=1268041 RepID=A0ABM8GS64_9MICO|nr:hypothetical protein GCM10025867_34980 [Frondihabitans sucicola]
MFVTADARERLMERRRQSFRDEFVTPLLREAEKLGIAPDQISHMILTEGIRA